MHHFAKASSECNDLYRDGYLIGAVMVSQAVAEGIWHFVLERNQIQPKKLKVGGGKKKNRPTIAAVLVGRKIISTECADAFVRIWRSFRNDVHHMNPKISTVNFPEVAKRNMADLAAIESELFAVTFRRGRPRKDRPSSTALLGSSRGRYDVRVPSGTTDRPWRGGERFRSHVWGCMNEAR